MRKVETYSVDDKTDIDIINYLKTISNKTQYIKSLIRKDMENKRTLTDAQLAEVEGLIYKILENNKFTINNEKKEKEVEVDQDVLDALSMLEGC